MKPAAQALPVAELRLDAAPRLSDWNMSLGKRIFDLGSAVTLLILASPLMCLLALLIKLSSRGPVFYRQSRVGQGGRDFRLVKFRTMAHAPRLQGPQLTRTGDPRITFMGRILRRWKLDELPQLFNVVRGEMSLVGPRPDVAEYIAQLNREQKQVLQLRPGLTGSATLQYRNEEELLAQVPEKELTQFYCTQVLPQKVSIDMEYASRACFRSDLGILFRTAYAIVN